MMSGKKLFAGCCIAGAAILLAGACSPQPDGRNAVLVEEVYVVKSGIEENNPWLLDRHGMIYPGDKLTLTYWVRGNE